MFEFKFIEEIFPRLVSSKKGLKARTLFSLVRATRKLRSRVVGYSKGELVREELEKIAPDGFFRGRYVFFVALLGEGATHQETSYLMFLEENESSKGRRGWEFVKAQPEEGLSLFDEGENNEVSEGCLIVFE